MENMRHRQGQPLALRSSLHFTHSIQATGHRPLTTFSRGGSGWLAGGRHGGVGGPLQRLDCGCERVTRARVPPTTPMTQSPGAAARYAGNRLRPSLPPITANGNMRWLATPAHPSTPSSGRRRRIDFIPPSIQPSTPANPPPSIHPSNPSLQPTSNINALIFSMTILSGTFVRYQRLPRIE
jgi:hypothetical protein